MQPGINFILLSHSPALLLCLMSKLKDWLSRPMNRMSLASILHTLLVICLVAIIFLYVRINHRQTAMQQTQPNPTPQALSAMMGMNPDKKDIFLLFYANVSVPGQNGTQRDFDGGMFAKTEPEMIIAGAGYFSIFHYQWLAGQQEVMNQPGNVVLTQSQCASYFDTIPTERLLGRIIIYNDSVKVKLAGIVRETTKPGNGFKDFIAYRTFIKNK